jgi:hypothetical protein
MNTMVNEEYQEQIEAVSLTAEEHFVFNLYASIYALFVYIHRLAGLGGESLEKYFERYPFLKEYFSQLSNYMPKNIDWNEGGQWWRKNIMGLEEAQQNDLPLHALRQGMELSFGSRMALMLAGLVEEDSRFGTLFAELQQPLGYRRPMLETLGHIVLKQTMANGESPWDVCGPLIKNGLLEAENSKMPRAEWVLRVRPLVWDLVRGNANVSEVTEWTYKHSDELLDVENFLVEKKFHALLKSVPALIGSGQARLIILRALSGSHSIDALGTIARQLDKGLLICERSPAGEKKLDDSFGSICTILDAMPIFIYDLGPGDTVSAPKLTGYKGPVGIVIGEEGGLKDTESDQMITLTMPNLDPGLREQLWQQQLSADWQIENPQQIARQFRLPGDYIRQVAQMSQTHAALESRRSINRDDVQHASRNLNRQMLDALADPLEAKGNWNHLVAVETTAEKLIELQQRCCYREQLLDQLGQAFQNSSNCGVRALFTGRSGTGKTLAAKILASELGMDIYRVDLAAIINKYIGETEKNLHKVLSRAEALDVILLIDEGDALLGSRTDVKSSNDRYANLETNYLLQRLEHYQGIVLITTNLSENIDKAFQRRMDIVIPFFQPQMEQRLDIFLLHLPDNHQIDYRYLQKVANFCTLNGGQIRNVSLHAALRALEDDSGIHQSHLNFALRSEYRKNGGTFPLDALNNAPTLDGGMDAFVTALTQRP